MPYHRTIGSIDIFIYDRESHGPAHVHVWCKKGTEGLIAIETLEVISAGKLPPACLKAVKKWMGERRDELMAVWSQARERQHQGGDTP
ncbi:MAG: DUF4160 domain-containing protein [Desulfomonilaceae bacterium]|nr:DUF4160 domain-containing protein [Desulfomonilaceae bacterium]